MAYNPAKKVRVALNKDDRGIFEEAERRGERWITKHGWLPRSRSSYTMLHYFEARGNSNLGQRLAGSLQGGVFCMPRRTLSKDRGAAGVIWVPRKCGFEVGHWWGVVNWKIIDE